MEANRILTAEINAAHAEKAMEAMAESIDIDYERSQPMLNTALVVLRHYADVHGLDFYKALADSEEQFAIDNQ